MSLRANWLLDRTKLLQKDRGLDGREGSAAAPNCNRYSRRGPAITALKAHNVPYSALLQRAGFSADDFDVGRQRISAASQGKFLEYAAEALDDSASGLHLAKEANPREAGLLFYVTSAASNVGEALALFARYSRIVNEAVCIKRAPAREGLIAEISFTGLSRHAAEQVTEFGARSSRARSRLTNRSRSELNRRHPCSSTQLLAIARAMLVAASLRPKVVTHVSRVFCYVYLRAGTFDLFCGAGWRRQSAGPPLDG